MYVACHKVNESSTSSDRLAYGSEQGRQIVCQPCKGGLNGAQLETDVEPFVDTWWDRGRNGEQLGRMELQGQLIYPERPDQINVLSKLDLSRFKLPAVSSLSARVS